MFFVILVVGVILLAFIQDEFKKPNPNFSALVVLFIAALIAIMTGMVGIFFEIRNYNNG